MPTDYDAFAHDFSQSRQTPWPEFELLAPHLRRGDRVLDLGCGNARMRDWLPESVVPRGNYFGFDVSQGLLDLARKEHPGEHFFRGDFGKGLPFGSHNFEIVTCVAAFHHLLSKKEQKRFLVEALRVMKPGGILFLTTWKIPGKHRWSNLLRGRWKNWVVPFGPQKHKRIYRRANDKELRKLLKKAGFKVIHCKLFAERNYVAMAEKI